MFNNEFLEEIRRRFSGMGGVQVRNDLKIVVKTKFGKGFLHPVYVKWANGYYLVMGADRYDFSDFIKETPPPYKPNNLSRELFSHTSLSEKQHSGALFANASDGHFKITNSSNRHEIIANVTTKIVEHYFRPLKDFVDMSPSVIDNVIEKPEYYSYPFATAVFSAQHNHITRDAFPVEQFIKMKLFGKDGFDDELLKKLAQ